MATNLCCQYFSLLSSASPRKFLNLLRHAFPQRLSLGITVFGAIGGTITVLCLDLAWMTEKSGIGYKNDLWIE